MTISEPARSGARAGSSASTPSTSAAPSGPPSMRGTIGTVVCRGIIPLWVLTGAAFKLMERNPNLLPPPVRSVIFAVHDQVKSGTTEQFLDLAMRSIIGVEFMLVAGMIFLPRLSKWICLATLGLFIAILGILVSQGALQCGCFGANGPKPGTVLAVDSALFVLAAIFGPARARGSVVAFLLASVVGFGLAFGVPSKSIGDPGASAPSAAPAPSAPAAATTTPPTDGSAGSSAPSGATSPAGSSTPSGTAAAPAGAAPPSGAGTPPAPGPSAPDRGAASTPPKSTPPPKEAPPAAAASEWPPLPAKPKGFYAPRFNTWVGQRLSAQEMMHMLKRPLPAGFDQGKWHIVLYRVDCDHCQELINNHFEGKLATRTMLVKVPDASPGKALPNRATDVVRSELVRMSNGPDYVIGTPIVLTVVDGVVKAVCEKPAEDPDSLAATLDAE